MSNRVFMALASCAVFILIWWTWQSTFSTSDEIVETPILEPIGEEALTGVVPEQSTSSEDTLTRDPFAVRPKKRFLRFQCFDDRTLEPVEGARLALYPVDSEQPTWPEVVLPDRRDATTSKPSDEKGLITMPLRVGTRRLMIRPVPPFAEVVDYVPSEKLRDVEEDAPTIVVFLHHGTPLRGKVIDHRGQPVLHGRLLFSKRGGIFPGRIQNGKFDAGTVLPGELDVYCDVGHVISPKRLHTESGVDTTSVTIELSARPALIGTVRDVATLEPVPNFQLDIRDGENYFDTCRTDAEGNFRAFAYDHCRPFLVVDSDPNSSENTHSLLKKSQVFTLPRTGVTLLAEAFPVFWIRAIDAKGQAVLNYYLVSKGGGDRPRRAPKHDREGELAFLGHRSREQQIRVVSKIGYSGWLSVRPIPGETVTARFLALSPFRVQLPVPPGCMVTLSDDDENALESGVVDDQRNCQFDAPARIQGWTVEWLAPPQSTTFRITAEHERRRHAVFEAPRTPRQPIEKVSPETTRNRKTHSNWRGPAASRVHEGTPPRILPYHEGD